MNWIAHQNDLSNARYGFFVLGVVRSNVLKFLPQADLVVLERDVFELR